MNDIGGWVCIAATAYLGGLWLYAIATGGRK